VVQTALAELRRTAVDGGNLVPSIIDAVKVRGTLGEISAVLKELWGPYHSA
jgi:methylmalonyl-CoA mutase N-terminal domain/subunit